MPAPKDITGQRFGRLVARERRPDSSWLCLCDCGEERVVKTGKLTTGHTGSCGCSRRRFPQKTGDLRHIYRMMIKRCHNKDHHAYSRYGGRGIRVCDRWLNSYEAFLSDVMPRPSLSHTLDRKDNEGDYEPSNVRWATRSEQQQNRHRALSREDIRIVRKLRPAEASRRFGISKTYASQIRSGKRLGFLD